MTPLLGLDFTSAILDPRITFTRSGATATVINSSGFIETVSADAPRFNHDPVTLVCKGLLIEEAATNLLLNSNNFTSTWVNSGTVTANNAISPDGTLNAAKFEGGVSYQDVVKAASAITYTTSLYFKQGSGNLTLRLSDGLVANYAQVVFNLATGVISTAASVLGNFTNASATISSAGGGYYRVTLTCTSNTVPLIRTRYAFTGTGNYTWLYGAQLEAGAFATSYIPTTTTALTRNADVATITGSNFASFWNATQGGATVQALPSTVSGICPLVQYDDGTANEIIALRGNTTNPELYIIDGGTPQAQLDAGTIAANTAYSLTGWWATNDCRARKDSGAAVTDTTATIPTVTQARLGSDGTNYLNGTIATINYYAAFSSRIYTRRKNKAVFSLL